MNNNEILKTLQTVDYNFLRTNKYLGDNILFLTVGGSHAYGTNIPGSDLDIRGVTANSPQDLLGLSSFDQVCDKTTDTTVYSIKKFFNLLLGCNPNVIEMLGCQPEMYFNMKSSGRRLLENKHLFLSQRAVHSFGGYANAQLRRLGNKAIRSVGQDARERHILNSIENARYAFKDSYFDMPDDAIRLYIDKAVQEGMDSEIFMDVVLKHYPLCDYKSMWNEMSSIVKEYSKIGKRNQNAVEHGKLAKHMMHLVRLFLMAFDILEKEEIITYRSKDHDFLMSIRNGDYLDENLQPIPEFYDIVHDFEARLERDKKETSLPPAPDYKKAEELLMEINVKSPGMVKLWEENIF